ncbi:genetic suppressor element 1 [Elysia marginata]|uniref:Genetic suppressor element 1 n=1 Tax=Elysia marginata TaxID=1093978 RepID=A0AAV4GE82_9GAST|nr:genetic suppressor element 1 [Elysia marginata]
MLDTGGERDPPPEGWAARILASTTQNHNLYSQQQQMLAYHNLAALAGYHGGDPHLGPLGASKTLLNVPGSPHIEAGKLPPKTATVPPLNHHTSPGSNAMASGSGATLRTSGFAAALRKLAHQAKDSTDDPGIKQTSSPPDRHSSRDMTSKLRNQGSSQLNFPSWPLSSAPVVTIAPTQTHPAHHQQHKSKSHERGVPLSLTGSSSFEQQHPLHYHHQSHHRDQHRSVSPNSKLDINREQNLSNRQSSLTSHPREDHWIKDGQDSRSSSRITPQAPISSPPTSNNYSLSNQALSNPSLASQALHGHGLTREAMELYARGINAYRPEDEALRLGLTGAGLPYGIDPAAYAAYAAAAAAYHPAILQQQAVLAAHSPYRFEDPLLLERYRFLQASSPYLAFPGLAGLSSLAGLGLHPALAAAAASGPPSQFSPGHLAPPELLQRYPHPYLGANAGQQHPLLDPLLDPRLAAAQAAMLERSRIEEEKARELKENERSPYDKKRVSAPGSNSSSRGREPGEREHTRQPSYENHNTESSAAQDLVRTRHLAEQRDSVRGHPHQPHRDKPPFLDTKVSSGEHGQKAHRAHENPRDSHVRHQSPRDSYTKYETSRNSHTGAFKPKLSPHNTYTHVIKPYDRVVDQQLSLGDSSIRHHDQEPSHHIHGRRLPIDGNVSPSLDKHKAQMLSPPIQRPWSSISSTSSSSHQNHHYHRHNADRHQQSTANKERSSSDFFRPFDDHIGKKDNDISSVSSAADSSRAEKDKEDPRVFGASSLPPSHHHSQMNSNISHGSHSSSLSANILSIPSVKVYPHHWQQSNTHDIPPEGLTFPKPLTSPASSTVVPPTSSASLTAPGGPPPLLPSLQLAGVVSDITPAEDLPPSNQLLPTISRCITDRIERFDFKSLARECTASDLSISSELHTSTDPSVSTRNSKYPVSKLDRRELALHLQKRRQSLGVDANISSFICSEEECGDEEEERMVARLTMISRASPIPLDTDPNKLNLLEYLGLTTCKRKRAIEVKKEQRRRRKLRLASLSPVRQNMDMTEVFDSSPVSLSSSTTALGADHSPSGKEQREQEDKENHEKKATFLAVLGLRALSHDRKNELSRQRKIRMHLARKNGFGLLKTKQNILEGDTQHSRYHLQQASQQDLEEAAARMDRHMAMWADKLREVDKRNQQ